MYYDHVQAQDSAYRMHGLWIEAAEWACHNRLDPKSPDIVQRYQKLLAKGSKTGQETKQ